MRPDCMVDIESYSHLGYAAIASIGAVKYDIVNRTLGDTFYVTISPASCKEIGLHFAKETLDWWAQQSKEAVAAIRKDNIHIRDALTQFADWIGNDVDQMCCWGFLDLSALDTAFYLCGMETPWKYWDAMEMRSISKFLGGKIDRSSGTHHNALNDAIVQAKFIIELLNPVEENS